MAELNAVRNEEAAILCRSRLSSVERIGIEPMTEVPPI
jgi:hypothetical protein